MIIHFNPDWRIRSDRYNWIIETRRTGGAKERWNAMGYYGDLDRAVLGLVQRRIRVMASTTVPRPSRHCAGLWRAWRGNLAGTSRRGNPRTAQGGRMTHARLWQARRHGTQLG